MKNEENGSARSQPGWTLIFEPHGGYGARDFNGDPWPFGYISEDTSAHRLPIFELSTILERPAEELRAYARLFTAAPDMLEALKAMLRLADMGFEESLREPEVNGNFAAYELARAALSKATAVIPCQLEGGE